LIIKQTGTLFAISPLKSQIGIRWHRAIMSSHDNAIKKTIG